MKHSSEPWSPWRPPWPPEKKKTRRKKKRAHLAGKLNRLRSNTRPAEAEGKIAEINVPDREAPRAGKDSSDGVGRKREKRRGQGGGERGGTRFNYSLSKSNLQLSIIYSFFNRGTGAAARSPDKQTRHDSGGGGRLGCARRTRRGGGRSAPAGRQPIRQARRLGCGCGRRWPHWPRSQPLQAAATAVPLASSTIRPPVQDLASPGTKSRFVQCTRQQQQHPD